MFSSFWIKITLYQPEVYDVDNVLLFPYSYEEVLRLYITMYETFIMEVLNSVYALNCYKSKSLKREFPFAENMESLQARSQNFHDHHIIVSFKSAVQNFANPHWKIIISIFPYLLNLNKHIF